MPWGDNGTTTLRTALDQAPTFTWGGAQVPLNFNPLNNVGYLRRVWLRVPYSSTLLTLTATADPVAVPAESQYPVHRGIGSFSLIAQGIAPLYQLSKGGIDLALLAYVGSGRRQTARVSPTASQSNAITNTGQLGHTSDLWKYRQGVIVSASGGATQTAQYASTFDVPLTEDVWFPGGMMSDGKGGSVAVPGQWAEIGLLTAQNTQQNLRLSVVMNPLYTVSGGSFDTVLTSTTANPVTTVSATMQAFSEFYDVPENPQNSPPNYIQDWVFTRQTRDWPVAGTNVYPKFEAAGMLVRAIYLFLDANDQIIDISGQATDGTISFMWGSSVYKFNGEPFEFNLARHAEIYGDPPPMGTLYHEFFANHVLTDLPNTAILASLRAEIKGLPAAVTTCHVIEERMIPVRG